jgi:hypothetical protein
MSIITNADFEGAMVMGEVVVSIVKRGPGEGVEWCEGWVRSKPVREECSQKFDFEPMRALRCGSEGMVEFEAMAVVDQVLSACGSLAKHLVLVFNPGSAKDELEIYKATI